MHHTCITEAVSPNLIGFPCLYNIKRFANLINRHFLSTNNFQEQSTLTRIIRVNYSLKKKIHYLRLVCIIFSIYSHTKDTLLSYFLLCSDILVTWDLSQ